MAARYPPASVRPADFGGKIGQAGAFFGICKTDFEVCNNSRFTVMIYVGAVPFTKSVSSVSLGLGQVSAGATFTVDPSAASGVQHIMILPGGKSLFKVNGSAGRVSVVFQAPNRQWFVVRKDREISNGEMYQITDAMLAAPLGYWVQ